MGKAYRKKYLPGNQSCVQMLQGSSKFKNGAQLPFIKGQSIKYVGTFFDTTFERGENMNFLPLFVSHVHLLVITFFDYKKRKTLAGCHLLLLNMLEEPI